MALDDGIWVPKIRAVRQDPKNITLNSINNCSIEPENNFDLGPEFSDSKKLNYNGVWCLGVWVYKEQMYEVVVNL